MMAYMSLNQLSKLTRKKEKESGGDKPMDKDKYMNIKNQS